MTGTENLISDCSDLIDEHRVWLEPLDRQRLDKWEELLRANPEAALCEAATRRLLSDHGAEVKPHDKISGGGPDFLCSQKGERFYAEATCITKQAATKETGLSDLPPRPSGGQHFRLLTKRIFYEMCSKTPQCSKLTEPCVLAIGTLHFQAGFRCLDERAAEHLLTGTPRISIPFDPEQGRAIGDLHQTTNLRDS